MNHIVMGYLSMMDYNVSLSWPCKDNMNYIVMGHLSMMDYNVSLSWPCKDNITL